jgi:hypothetical protein
MAFPSASYPSGSTGCTVRSIGTDALSITMKTMNDIAALKDQDQDQDKAVRALLNATTVGHSDCWELIFGPKSHQGVVFTLNCGTWLVEHKLYTWKDAISLDLVYSAGTADDGSRFLAIDCLK